MSEFLFYTSVTLLIIIAIAFSFEKIFKNRLFQKLSLSLVLIIGILLLVSIFIDKQDGLSNLLRGFFVLILCILFLNFISSLVSLKRAIIWGTLWILISVVLLITS
ncbi:hypothetical protein BK128_03610 [Viridibacillus sp. FSL H7-0596]|nr:hypothetical protein BK128_03610 [Viridibacillus sp. FSL H7-0596]